MSPIAPGTLCILVGDAAPAYLGKIVTAQRRTTTVCELCASDVYSLGPMFGFEEAFACRKILQPILPPGVDVNSTANEELKVKA